MSQEVWIIAAMISTVELDRNTWLNLWIRYSYQTTQRRCCHHFHILRYSNSSWQPLDLYLNNHPTQASLQIASNAEGITMWYRLIPKLDFITLLFLIIRLTSSKIMYRLYLMPAIKQKISHSCLTDRGQNYIVAIQPSFVGTLFESRISDNVMS